MDATRLEEALVAANAAVAAGDGSAAAEALARAEAEIAALARAGHPLPPEDVARLRALQAQGQAAAEALLGRLADALDLAGRSRRATAAYGSNRPT